jgi:hypothetical protein
MATVVGEIPKGKYTKHPWDEWFDGQLRELEFGVDFFTGTKSFYQNVRQAAARYKVRVLVTTQGDRVYVQKVNP